MFKKMVNIKEKRPIIEMFVTIFKIFPQDNGFVCMFVGGRCGCF